jgi:AcrR family transcriptional regulator
MSGADRALSVSTTPKTLTATAAQAYGSNGRARERVAEVQRARILTGMVDVVAERGIANVTVAHVVARSGVSRRTFYELFEDREDCFLAAMDEAFGHLWGYALEGFDPEARWRERMRTGLVGLLCFLDQEPAMGRLLVVESLGAGPGAIERRSRGLAKITAAVDEGRGEGRNGRQPAPLTAEGIVGGVLSVLHSRLLDRQEGSLLELTGPLMSMIVLPYFGVAAAQKESVRLIPASVERPVRTASEPLRDLQMRLTYRTIRVLVSVAAHPGSSNRDIGLHAGIADQGQISKLLSRLHRLGLIYNTGIGPTKGAPNAWALTEQGAQIERAIEKKATMPQAN